MAEYAPPLDQFLTLGRPSNDRSWRDYRALGIGPEHIPDLIRMATDRDLNSADAENLEVWAPLHAWRSLGELHAEQAIEPLLELLGDSPEDDYLAMDLPEVFSRIGPVAIPAVKRHIADESLNEDARIHGAEILKEIARTHPETREDCIGFLTSQLARKTDNPASLNGFLVSELVVLKAVEVCSTDRGCLCLWLRGRIGSGLLGMGSVRPRSRCETRRFEPLWHPPAQPLAGSASQASRHQEAQEAETGASQEVASSETANNVEPRPAEESRCRGGYFTFWSCWRWVSVLRGRIHRDNRTSSGSGPTTSPTGT